MQGTIRIALGFLLLMGGVGGIEANTEVALPLDSLAVALVGLAFFASGAFAAARQEESY